MLYIGMRFAFLPIASFIIFLLIVLNFLRYFKTVSIFGYITIVFNLSSLAAVFYYCTQGFELTFALTEYIDEINSRRTTSIAVFLLQSFLVCIGVLLIDRSHWAAEKLSLFYKKYPIFRLLPSKQLDPPRDSFIKAFGILLVCVGVFSFLK